MALSATQLDVLGGLLGFLFTVALLSYLIGDNPLYRIALHIFAGVSIGYVALVVIYQVIIPRVISPLFSGDNQIIAITMVPLGLFLFLVMKLNPDTSSLGNIGVAYLIGVGAALTVTGALFGTLFPQIEATWLSILPGGGNRAGANLIIILGTITALLYFQYWLGRDRSSEQTSQSIILRSLSGIGQGFVVVTLATIYGGMILSGIAIFSDRISEISRWIGLLLS